MFYPDVRQNQHFSLNVITGIFLFGVAYFVVAKVGLLLAPVGPSVAVVWSPIGIAVAVLLLFGHRFWPGVALGAFFANVTAADMPVIVALSIAGGSTLEVVATVYLTNRFAKGIHAFRRAHTFVRYIILAALGTTAISATIGIVSLFLSGLLEIENIVYTWSIWWLGNVGSTLLIAPSIVLWVTDWKYGWSRKYLLEATAIGLALVASVMLLSGNPPLLVDLIDLIVLLPILTLAAVRLYTRDTITLLLLVSIVVISGIATGAITLSAMDHDIRQLLIAAQTSLILLAITATITSSLTTERKELASRKDLFIGIASHELKTPLATLKILLQLVEHNVKAPEDSELEEHLNDMGAQIDATTKIITDLLDLAKMQSGDLVLERKRFAFGALVEEVIRDYQLLVPSHAITLRKLGDGDVTADRARIRRVLVNLLSNAVKYSPEANKVVVELRSSPKTLSLRIQDFGIGIPEKQQVRIFGRFFRADEARQRYPGLGIGLYVAAQTIEMHGGTISVESEEGKGSVFTFTLPLNAPARFIG